jgi:diguanylate cyclase (GGDEF)-like protein
MRSVTAGANMDPLVRAVSWLQRGLQVALGSLLALAAAAYLVVLHDPRHPARTSVVVLVVLLVSLGFRAHERYRKLGAHAALRLEAEIGLHVTVLLYAGIVSAPGGTVGAFQPLAYALAMWAGGFLCPAAAVTTLLSAAGLEAAIGWREGHPLTVQATHVGLLFAFGGLNLVVFRSEIARVRRLSREHIKAELQRLKDEARSYRLAGPRQSAVRAVALGAEAPRGDDERLSHSSVEQLQALLRFALPLLRRGVAARTAAVLWLEPQTGVLELREASSCIAGLERGPFSAKEGVFAAALASRGHLVVEAKTSGGQLPLYPKSLPAGSVMLAPLLEDQNVTGLLLVEGEPGWDTGEPAQKALLHAAEFIGRTIESERLFVALERTKTEQGKLYAAADMLAGARSEVQVIQAGVDAARQFTHFDFAAVTLFHRSSRSHEICAVSGDGADELVGRVFRHNGGLVSMVVANRHPLPYRGAYHASRQMVFDRHLPLPKMPSLIVLPLCVHDAALGTLILGSDAVGAFGEELRPTLEVLARHVAVSLANARMVKRLEELATTDGLTGLLNKRALTETARQKMRSSERFKKSLSLIIGDIDHFKRVNDNYGHDVGDQVIKGFGEVLRRSKRETDAVGRFGGEEFVLVCEQTDEAGALLLAERIRQELEATTFHTHSGPLQVTCSLGVATFPQVGPDWEALFKATDEALYVSKKAGRNRVTGWQPNMRGAAA